MPCPSCGLVIPATASRLSRCPRCAAPLAAASAATPLVVGTHGVPVVHFAPTEYGAPIAPAPFSAPGLVEEGQVVATRPPGYRPVVLPPPATRPRRRHPLRVLAVVLSLCLLLLAAGAGARLARNIHGPLHIGPYTVQVPWSAPSSVPANRPTSSACQHSPHTASGTSSASVPDSSMLENVQLTTGLQNAAQGDYRPVNATRIFRSGTRLYITFEVRTQQAGTISAHFCVADQQAQGSLRVPAQSAGRYGQFSLLLSPTSGGDGEAMLSWNGALAAEETFSVNPQH